MAEDQFSGFLIDGRQVQSVPATQESCRNNGWPTPFVGVANAYRCPLSWEHGEATLLLRRDDCAALSQKTTAVSLKMSHGSEITIFPGLFYHSALCVTPSWRGDPECVYMAKLVDRRFMANRYIFYDGGPRAIFNVRKKTGTPEYQESTLQTEGVTSPAHYRPYTWKEMLTKLWEGWSSTTHFNETWPGDPDGFEWPENRTPKGTFPDNVNCYGMGALEAIAYQAARIGLVICYDPLTDRFKLITDGGEDPEFLTSLETFDKYRLEDTDAVESVRARIPARAVVMLSNYDASADNVTLAPLRGVLVNASEITDFETKFGFPVSDLDPMSSVTLYDDAGILVSAARDVANQSIADFYWDTYSARRCIELFEAYLYRLTGGGKRESGSLNVTYASRRMLFDGLRVEFQPGQTVENCTWGDFGGGMVTMVNCDPNVRLPPKSLPVIKGSQCAAQSNVQHINPVGKFTGGEWTATVNGFPLTLPWDCAANTFQDALHAADTGNTLGDDPILVEGGPFPNVALVVTYQNDQKNKPQPAISCGWDAITGGVGVAILVNVVAEGREG